MVLQKRRFKWQCYLLLLPMLIPLIVIAYVNGFLDTHWIIFSVPAGGYSGNVSLIPANFSLLPAVQCTEIWPDLELLVPMPADSLGEREFNDTLLTSLALFWPQRHLKFAIITDAGTHGVDDFCRRLQNSTEALVSFTPRCLKLPEVPQRPGWHKSQWLKFWADNFTTSEFVGFLDTDALFVTRVALEDIFVDGKPVVTPIFGPRDARSPTFWSGVPRSTFKSTGFKEPFNCMSFFPVIVKRSHFAYFREHVQRHVRPHGTFDDAFIKIMLDARSFTYSEFNIMCAIMWNRFQSDYYWRVHDAKPGWKGDQGYRDGQVHSLEEANITSEFLHMSPTLTIHATHHDSYGGIKQALRTGVCYGMTDGESRPSYCDSFGNRTAKTNWLEFTFESYDFSKRPEALTEHRKRLARNDKCPHPWPQSLLDSIS